MGMLDRRTREKRAYQLVVATTASSVAAVVFLVLGVIGAIGYGPFVIAVIIAAGAAYGARRQVNP